LKLLLHHQRHRQLAPLAHYHRHPTIQHQPDNRGKDSVFTRNTNVLVIDQMKNKEGNGPH
jgi:hypothetical protein